MCRLFVADMVDFAVSDLWRDHYFESGQTPYHSPSYASCRDRLAQQQDQFEERLKVLLDAVERLTEQPQPEQRPRRAVVAQPHPPQPHPPKPSGSMNL